ncbi:MAG: YciI family protein [Chloroflexota bacterium]
MTTDRPADIAIEPTWLIEATYAPDAAETRVPFRGRHLARLAELIDAGVVVAAGAFADVSASIVIVRAADEAAALDIARGDIYLANGVWVELRARPFGLVVRTGAAGS